ncbi:MAG TPA: ExeM/NucH family extracellular endonuclease [Actinomycetota bacterium]|nr:ExeM/NucH family extracellular endonuclease [Actinomycetota bacterium]
MHKGSATVWNRTFLTGFLCSLLIAGLAVVPGPTSALAQSTTLVVNEIDYDQPSFDTAEFLEIKNVSDAAIDLDGYSVEMVNGVNGGASGYRTFALPDVSLAAGDYFVLCGNAANVPNCDLDVDPGQDLIQNGAPDAVAIRLGETLVDAVSYEGDTGAPYTEGSGDGLVDAPDPNESISRCADGVDTDQNNVDLISTTSTPGEANDCPEPPPPPPPFGACGDPATFIHEVQDAGATSPLDGSVVVVEGVVVGDFQNNTEADDGNLNGFYVQEEDAEADSNDETSEGVFVFASGADDVHVGDLVRIRAEVTEFVTSGGASSMTELTDVMDLAVCETAAPLPSPGTGTFPLDAPGDLERFEGMRTLFPQDLVISEYFNYDRFGEMVLSLPFEGQDRLHQPTAVVEPGAPAIALLEQIRLRRITLDDGQTIQNPTFTRHPNGDEFTLENRFRGGDTVANSIGVIDESFGLYRIQPTAGADYSATNPRPEEPDDVGGNMTVSSFNVLNYFLTLDLGPDICGPEQNQECRGADDAEEFERQRAKILAALSEIDADVFGLIEMENTTGVEPLADIVAGLNDIFGAGTYDYVDTGTIGTDAIKVGIIYKPGSVSPLGDYEILDSSVDPRFLDDKSRPVLAQTFADGAGGVFTVAVNHLKSKGSSCDDVGDPDTGDGQGNCNQTRTQAAEALVDWLATDPTASGDDDFLIIGDLNSYDKEDPIDAILEGADDVLGNRDDYTDLILRFEGELAYSFVFDGLVGYLDHALSTGTLMRQVTGATEWHINADEPDLLDYDTTFKSDAQDELYEPNEFRSSDHDPVVVGLDLNVGPSCAGAVASPDTLFPPNHRFRRIAISGVTDPEGDPVTITVDSIFQDEAVDAPDSGDTAPDGRGVGTQNAHVRAERVGTGNGRVYHIGFTATDELGGSCSGVVTVGVPINEGGVAVDDGPLFDSTVIP